MMNNNNNFYVLIECDTLGLGTNLNILGIYDHTSGTDKIRQLTQIHSDKKYELRGPFKLNTNASHLQQIRIKNLFPFLLALGTVTGQSNFSTDDLKVSGFSHASFYRTGYRVLKFHDLAAVKTDQVVVLSKGFYLIMMVGFGKIHLIYKPGLLESL